MNLEKQKWKGVTHIARRYDSEDSKRRILSASVRLFIEKGYRRTTIAEVIREADVSVSSFQNVFHNKAGILLSLTKFMLENQFSTAAEIVGGQASPAMLYATETSLQLALAETDENVRENYLEAYTCPETLYYIHHRMGKELHQLLGVYLPEDSEQDFYERELGTSGVVWAYMNEPCSEAFPLEQKVRRMLDILLDVFDIPEEEQRQAVEFVLGLNLEELAQKVTQKLFRALAVKFEFTLPEEKGNE